LRRCGATRARSARLAAGAGQSYLAEATSGTVPTDASSGLRIMDVTRQPNGGVLVTVASVAGQKYVLLAAANLAASFVPISTTNTAVSEIITFTDPAPSESSKAYKVQYIP
jgi:hypothetical protein